MTDIVETMHEERWDQQPDQDWRYGLAEGAAGPTSVSDVVPEPVRERVEAKERAILEAEFEVFPGMSDDQLRELYCLEPNVIAELPPRQVLPEMLPWHTEARRRGLRIRPPFAVAYACRYS